MGKVFTAWAKSQTLAAIAATVRTEYPTLVKPSDSFIAVTQTISRHPGRQQANPRHHAFLLFPSIKNGVSFCTFYGLMVQKQTQHPPGGE